MASISQTLTITLSSDSLTEAQLRRVIDENRDPIAVFVLNLLSENEIKSELKFNQPNETTS
jgi:hypothetical protein